MSSIDQQPGTPARGKRWAYAAAFVGGVVSVLANIAHSFVPSQPRAMADETWRVLPNASPQPGAVLLAAFWPLALLLAIEVLARVEWSRQLRWTLIRWGGVTPVALVAAIVSYRHLSGLLHWYAEDPITVTIGPAAVDGLMVVSTGALLMLAARMAPPIGSTIGSVEDPSTQPIGSGGESDGQSDGSEPVGSDGQPDADADGSDRVVPLHSVGSRADERAESSTPTGARPEDLERGRAAIQSGDLKKPLTADAIRAVLKIGLQHARAVRDTLNAEQDEEVAEA